MSYRNDGWQNLITGLHNPLRDKNLGMAPYVENFTADQCDQIYSSSDMAARIVDTLPNEMTRAGFDVRIEAGEDLAEIMEKRHEELETLQCMNKALKIARKQGGAAIFLGVNDEVENLAIPLDVSRVKRLDYLTVFESRELRAIEWQNNPFAKDFGLPSLYQVTPRGLNAVLEPEQNYIHASRLIRFDGTDYFRTEYKAQREWSFSVFTRVFSVIRQFESAWGSATGLMQDFAQAVFKITGLADAVSSDKEDLVRKRYEAIDYFRSSMRAIVIDAEKEQFERTNSQMGGLSDILEQFALRLAAAANMPAALLMGQSPSGLNSTGASEIRWFYDQVTAHIQFELKPAIRLITSLLFQEKGNVPENWSIEFRPLWQSTDKEIADVRMQMAQADSQYVAMGVLSPQEVAKSRFGGDAYSIETRIDLLEESGETEEAGESEETQESLRPVLNPEYYQQIMLLVQQAAKKEISRESAIAAMKLFFCVSPEMAEELLGPEIEAPNAKSGSAEQENPEAPAPSDSSSSASESVPPESE